MKAEVAREMILSLDSCQITDEFADAANIESLADVKKLIEDWQAAKLAARTPEEATADKDIEKWSKSK